MGLVLPSQALILSTNDLVFGEALFVRRFQLMNKNIGCSSRISPSVREAKHSTGGWVGTFEIEMATLRNIPIIWDKRCLKAPCWRKPSLTYLSEHRFSDIEYRFRAFTWQQCPTWKLRICDAESRSVNLSLGMDWFIGHFPVGWIRDQKQMDATRVWHSDRIVWRSPCCSQCRTDNYKIFWYTTVYIYYGMIKSKDLADKWEPWIWR